MAYTYLSHNIIFSQSALSLPPTDHFGHCLNIFCTAFATIWEFLFHCSPEYLERSHATPKTGSSRHRGPRSLFPQHLFRGNTAHAAPYPAHSPGAIGCLFFHASISCDNQIRILTFRHHLEALALQCCIDVRDRFLRQDGVLNLVLVVGTPCVRVILGETWLWL